MNDLPPRLRESDNASGWARGPLHLPLRFGEYKLGSVHFDGFVNTGHFLQRGAPLARLSSEARELLRSSDTDAALLSSQPSPSHVPTLSVGHGVIQYVSARFAHYYVALHGTFDDYLASLTSSRRATIRRKVRKVREAAGTGFGFEVVSQSDDLSRFLQRARAVSSKSYQERLLGSGLPGGADFAQWIAGLATRNRVRGYLLTWDDRPMCYMLCTARDRVLFYDWVGYDPDFAVWSPGAVLQHLALEHLYTERSFDIFDFTEGEGDHKRAFATDSVTCADIWYFSVAPRSVAAVAGHATMKTTSSSLVRLLSAARIKGRVKQFLRRRA